MRRGEDETNEGERERMIEDEKMW